MHGGHLAEIPRGSIAFKENEMMAAMDKFTIDVHGKGGHGASPHLAIDPIVISGEILMGLQKIISREIAPVDSALVSVCKINGGFTQNIIPDKVEMMGTARSLDENVRDVVEKRLGEICDGIAKTYGGSADVNYERFYPVLSNDPEFTEEVKSIVSNILPEDVFDLRKPVMGGEDMAFYQKEVPGCFMFLSNLAEHSDGVCYPNHNSKFNLDESLFYKGVATFIASAFEILK